MERIIYGKFDEDSFPYIDLEVLHQDKGLCLQAKAIIDTGAAHCLIREELALQLQLEAFRQADYRHPVFGELLLKEYLLDLCLEGNSQNGGAVIRGIRAGTLLDLHYPAHLIIGVELLRYSSFYYNGPAKTFTISFESPLI